MQSDIHDVNCDISRWKSLGLSGTLAVKAGMGELVLTMMLDPEDAAPFTNSVLNLQQVRRLSAEPAPCYVSEPGLSESRATQCQ
eukprot:1401027-Rhodomonas_salina.1